MSLRTRWISLVASTAGVFAPFAVFAQGFIQHVQSGVDAAGGQAGLNNAPTGGFPALIGKFIATALSLVGIVLFVIILQAGYMWMTAGGDSKRVMEARARIFNAVIGLLIVVSAYAISGFVLQQIAGVQGGTPTSATTPAHSSSQAPSF